MITGYNRPTVANVSLEAIVSNYKKIKDYTKSDTMIYAVVKANAYGHGATEVSKALSEAGADAFAVAISNEGIELREAGIERPILIMGLTDANHAALQSEMDLSTTFMTTEWLEQAKKNLIAEKTEKPLKVHMKVDSGMGRIGVRTTEEAQETIDYLAENKKHFYLEGIFTHYATADSLETDQVKKRENQSAFFRNFKKAIDLSAFDHKVIWHQSNSAMTLYQPEDTLDAIRPGSILYGLDPSMKTMDSPIELEPALSLKTELVNVKKMHAGDTISYGAIYTAEEDEWIGTLPIGYADGWLRNYSGIEVLVDGKRTPMVGRICMDQSMVHLPKSYPNGTTITLVGKNSGESITMEDVGEYGGTIGLEVSCLISNRVPRIYD